MDPDAEIRWEFRRRQSVQRQVQWMALLAGLPAFAGMRTCGAPACLLLGACLIVVASLLLFTIKNWRCPRCNRLLGKRLDISRCPHCDIDFS